MQKLEMTKEQAVENIVLEKDGSVKAEYVKRLLTIIVPVYNSEKYLRVMIDSLAHQTYTNKELLLIDDGSKDRSPLRLESLQMKCNLIAFGLSIFLTSASIYFS